MITRHERDAIRIELGRVEHLGERLELRRRAELGEIASEDEVRRTLFLRGGDRAEHLARTPARDLVPGTPRRRRRGKDVQIRQMSDSGHHGIPPGGDRS